VIAIVVPFRGANGKSRLPEPLRTDVALAMLEDVLAACTAAGATTVVTDDPRAERIATSLGAHSAPDPGLGLGAAVAAVLDQLEGPALVVNADVPCVASADLRALAGAAEAGALALVEARDGTTNALALPDAGLFVPLYGRASAARFLAHARAQGVETRAPELPNLADDVDTLADLHRVGRRAGPRTQAALARHS
jgi:2-phospho-L-lactate guanylyltransferase